MLKYLALSLVLLFTGCRGPKAQAFWQGLGGATSGGYNQYQMNTLNANQIQHNFNSRY
jgi:hypothetical protein